MRTLPPSPTSASAPGSSTEANAVGRDEAQIEARRVGGERPRPVSRPYYVGTRGRDRSFALLRRGGRSSRPDRVPVGTRTLSVRVRPLDEPARNRIDMTTTLAAHTALRAVGKCRPSGGSASSGSPRLAQVPATRRSRRSRGRETVCTRECDCKARSIGKTRTGPRGLPVYRSCHERVCEEPPIVRSSRIVTTSVSPGPSPIRFSACCFRSASEGGCDERTRRSRQVPTKRRIARWSQRTTRRHFAHSLRTP